MVREVQYKVYIGKSVCMYICVYMYIYLLYYKVGHVLHALEASNVCEGNPDEKFNLLSASRKGIFRDQTGQIFF